MRPSNRQPDQMRPVSLTPGFSRHAEGSCLVKFGDTHVLVTASLEEKAPPFLKGSGTPPGVFDVAGSKSGDLSQWRDWTTPTLS